MGLGERCRAQADDGGRSRRRQFLSSCGRSPVRRWTSCRTPPPIPIEGGRISFVLHAGGPAADEVEDQDDHGDYQKQVNYSATDVTEQTEKPENSDNDGYPEQHESLLHLVAELWCYHHMPGSGCRT